MSTPILATKFFIPPLRDKIVLRPRLIERLNEGLGQNQGFARKLTLVSAPAGFGKTTLVSEWVAGSGAPTVAWLSLDEEDSDPARFVTYLVAALQTIPVSGDSATIGEGVLAMLESPQPPPTESVLTALLNEITAILDKFILVLDDYHVLDAEPIDNALTFLLEHLPPQMHVAITTRVDPDLPLARFRVRDQLTEVRATELRFTPAEAAGFLNQVMDLNLSTEEITALETRTEGWIAGLQMAALSMQGCEDISGFIRAFAGHDRYIVDYLVEEVLQRQPERVRSFLLQTSILDRLSGPVCDAVTGHEDGKGMLEDLERGNLFVIPLDDKRQWYRYHHLFADVLHAHSTQEQPDRVSALHRRASEWYEQNGLPAEGIRHALAAKARLRDAEQWLESTDDMSERPEVPWREQRPFRSAEMVVVDEEQFRSLPATIAAARAYIAQALDDVPGTVKYARRALDLLPEGDHLRRGMVAALLGLTYWTSGDLEEAYRTFADGMASFQIAGDVSIAISGTYVLADIRTAQGRLREAVRTFEQSLQLVDPSPHGGAGSPQGEAELRGTSELYLGLGELHREQGNQQAARQHLLRSEELGEQAGLPNWRHRWYLAQARIKEDQGDLDGALDQLLEAERIYFRNPIPGVRPVAALKTRVWVAQGRLTEALGWARERDLSADDELSYLREFEHITLARVLIAKYKSDPATNSIHEAHGLLERLLAAAEEGRRTGSVIEILVVQALAHQAQGNISLALTPLEHALALAEPEGYVRLFVDEGPPMAQLLSEVAARGNLLDYTGKLLAVFEAEKQSSVDRSALSPAPPSQPHSEPLSTTPAMAGTDNKGRDAVGETNDPEESIDRPDHIVASGWSPWDRLPLSLGDSSWDTLRKVGVVLGMLSALVALSLNAPRLWKEQVAPEVQEPAMPAPLSPTATFPSATATLPTVAIEGPAMAPLGEKTYFTIVSENAVRAEWTASGFQGNEVIPVETLSPLYEIYVEPTDANRVGDSFTILVTVFDSEGRSAVARKRFQVVAD